MKFNRFCSLIVSVLLVIAMLTGICTAEGQESDIVAFSPIDCGLPEQDEYDYPFIGMTLRLPETILQKMDSWEIFAFTQEDYTADYQIAYAVIRFSATTEADRSADSGLSADIFAFEAGLEKIGAIGAYRKDQALNLDELTACDTHEKLGESADGAYEYYLSIHSKGDSALTAELKKAEAVIGEMHDFDPNLGYTAFSTDRIDGVATVGSFSTEDVFGNAYTQDVFGEYDLTLVNVFATWCSPCVQEIPELEKLRQEYEQAGVKLGIVAVVLDVRIADGMDEGALERAKLLYERSGAQFPFLIPDDGNMNGRLTGIESVPESFFVDSEGNIVSDPYIGANTLEGWKEIVDQELANQKAANE